MKMEIKEIRFGTEDYEEAFRLRDKVLREPEGRALTREELPFDRDSSYFAAYLDRTMAGVVLWYRDQNTDTGVVKHLAVLAEARGRHIGRLLLERAEKDMLQAGIRRVAVKARVPAKPFYERSGYRAAGPSTGDETGHIMMEKTLIGEEATLLYLIRHGMTGDNLNGVLQGSRDVPLGEAGVEQANCLRTRFRNVRLDALYASPLVRAYETAKILGEPHGLTPITDRGLAEAYCGLMEGNSSELNGRLYPEQMDCLRRRPAAFCPPEGESGRQVYDRVVAAMDRIVSKNRGRDIAVVSHGFAIELYLGYARHVPFDLIENYIVENCAVSTLTYDAAGQVTLLRVNDVSHLPDSLRFHTEERFSSRV